jgi:hypothetical protein
MTFERRFKSPIRERRDALRPRGVGNPQEIFPITKTNNK